MPVKKRPICEIRRGGRMRRCQSACNAVQRDAQAGVQQHLGDIARGRVIPKIACIVGAQGLELLEKDMENLRTVVAGTAKGGADQSGRHRDDDAPNDRRRPPPCFAAPRWQGGLSGEEVSERYVLAGAVSLLLLVSLAGAGLAAAPLAEPSVLVSALCRLWCRPWRRFCFSISTNRPTRRWRCSTSGCR